MNSGLSRRREDERWSEDRHFGALAKLLGKLDRAEFREAWI